MGKKICRLMDEALKVKAPLIGLNDSGGGRLHEGFRASKGVAGMFFRNTQASGIIPQISAMMGSCAGVSVYSPAITDFIIMVEKTSHMIITGPHVIKQVTGEEVDLEELGGAKVHSEITGQAHLVAPSEAQCIQTIKKLLSFLPANNDELPPAIECTDDPNRTDDTLEEIVPANFRRAYDMHKVINRIVDHGEFFEILPKYAKNIIIGFARLNGQTVGNRGQSNHGAGRMFGREHLRQSGPVHPLLRCVQHSLDQFGGCARLFSRCHPGACRHHSAWRQDALCLCRGHGA
jgi:acetyl-CoA carboxylase carboxyltransferase component